MATVEIVIERPIASVFLKSNMGDKGTGEPKSTEFLVTNIVWAHELVQKRRAKCKDYCFNPCCDTHFLPSSAHTADTQDWQGHPFPLALWHRLLAMILDAEYLAT